MIRTGVGYDVHKLIKGDSLIVGSVEIPSNFKSVGHSDGDCLIHAIVDAMLGAANLGDIGCFFPSSDNKWKGSPSSIFLQKAVCELKNAGYEIINIDSTVVLQRPVLSEHIFQIRNNLSLIMDINENQISVKATTTDGIGTIGLSEGWSAFAIATISKID
tara:strand:+ start:1031 stop:1510 length:480 start_codon:yes stop_codon:yes gene_type:complete